MELPDEGEAFSAPIDRRSEAGNGIIELDSGNYINIGPIKRTAVGESVFAVYLRDLFAICLTPNVNGPDYDDALDSMQKADS